MRLRALALLVLTACLLTPITALGISPADPPTGLSAVAGDGRVTLRWTEPASDGGSPVADFEVSVSDGGWLSLGVTSSPGLVAGLTNGLAYTFRVRAVTGAGPGTASVAVAATPGGTPGPITSPTVTAVSETSVTVAWSPPYDNGGSVITGYEYALDGGSWTSVAKATVTLTGLSAGSSYSLRVRALNASGPGAVAPAIDLRTTAAIASSPSVAPSPSASPSADLTAGPGPSPTSSLAGSPTDGPVAEEPVVFELALDVVIGRPVTGREVRVEGRGLLPGSTVTLVLYSEPVLLGRATVGGDGAFSVAARLPSGVAAGEHRVVARGTSAAGLPVERVGAFALDRRGRVAALAEDERPFPAPGYRPSLPGGVIASRGKPGVSIARTEDGRLLYIDERGSTNAIAASIPSLTSALLSLRNAVTAGFGALAMAVLGLILGTPVELLKGRVKRTWAALVAHLPRRTGRQRARWVGWLSAAAFLALGQFIATLNAPLDRIAPLRQVGENVAYGVVAILLMSHIKQRPDIRIHRELHDDTGSLTAEWANLLLTAFGVLFAQLIGLVPGFVIGVWAARRFRASLAEEHSAPGAWRSGLSLLGASLVAWMLLDVAGLLFPDPSSLFRGFADTVLAMFVVGGTQGLIWALAGPGEETGARLRRWSVTRWSALLFLASLALVGMVAAGGSTVAAFFRPQLDVATELRLLASGIALLGVLAGIERWRSRRLRTAVS